MRIFFSTMLLIFFLPISFEAVAPKTYGEFIGWYERTANGGSLQTQYLLGYMNKTGKGRTKDLKAAKKWFGKAANNGHSLSQLQLAKLLFKDSAVEGNLNHPDLGLIHYWTGEHGGKIVIRFKFESQDEGESEKIIFINLEPLLLKLLIKKKKEQIFLLLLKQKKQTESNP